MDDLEAERAERTGIAITRASAKYVRIEMVDAGEPLVSVVLDRRSAITTAWQLFRIAIRDWR